MSRFTDFLARVAAWWRANRLARADADDLAAELLRTRAEGLTYDDPKARRLLARAEFLKKRAATLRAKTGP